MGEMQFDGRTGGVMGMILIVRGEDDDMGG